MQNIIEHRKNTEKQKKNNNGGKGFQKVEVIDYSDEYSHPYFKPIVKGENIQEISHELLLKKNDSPKVFPLHFAIEKERQDLV